MNKHRLELVLVVLLHTLARAEAPAQNLELSVTVSPGSSRLSQVVLKRVSATSTLGAAGLRAGDAIEKVNDDAPTLEQLSLLALPQSVYTKRYSIAYVRDGAVSTVVAQGGARSQALRVVLAFHEGQWIGLKVLGLEARSASVRAGLRNGDVLVSINGQALRTPESVLEAVTRAELKGPARVEVERGGQRLVLNLPAQELFANLGE